MLLLATRLTVYVPALAKVMFGFCELADAIVTPAVGLVVHAQLVGVLVDASVKAIGCPAHLVAAAVKFAVGIAADGV